MSTTAPMPHRAAGLQLQRLGAGAALTLGVLLVHAWLVGPAWQRQGAAPPATQATRGARPLQVRQIVQDPATAAGGAAEREALPVMGQTALLAAIPVTTPVTAPVMKPLASGPASIGHQASPADEIPPGEREEAATSEAGKARLADAADPGAMADTEDSTAPLPTYATRPPAAATLTYLWQRGGLLGQAQLTWAPRESDYELTWSEAADGSPALGGQSRGRFDSAGLAPERHVDRRRGRDLRATNFDRENGHIAYSASPRRHVLPPGVQDRLSWMLQLPAMLEADPALAAPGTELLLAVAGARGQMGVWTFDVVGAESLALPGGEVPAALHLQRAARRPYDTQVDVWLDPARAHLPVRLKVSAPPAPGVTEWRLQSLSTP